MDSVFSTRFVRSYHKLPVRLRKKFDKQLIILIKNLRHPSLRAKKYDEARGVWQARVDNSYRFYFLIRKDLYVLLNIKPHPK